MQPFNPYAPPQDAAPFHASGFTGHGVWQQDGRAVLYASGAMLPDRCAACNAPGKHRVSKTFYWHEPWLYALILAGWLVYAIVAMIVRKSANVEYWLCDEHRKRRTLGLVLVWCGFLVPLFGMLVAAFAQSGVLVIVCLVAMIALPITGGLMARMVKPTRIDDMQVWLKAGEPFVASLPTSPNPGGMGYLAPPGAMMGSPYGASAPPRW